MTGIVIVCWNSADVLEATLRRCVGLPDADIVVVDNNSSDGTAELARRHPGVTVIANPVNRGFAGGVNQGIAALPHCRAVLLLNPDAEPLNGVEALAHAVLKPGAGAAGGRLIDGEGRTQEGFQVRQFPTPFTLACEVMGINRIWPWNPWNRRLRMHGFDPTRPAEVEQPAGAFLMLSRAAWAAVGGLDERFHPAWFEDVDLCLRMKRAGYSIEYVPEATARHVGGHSASRLAWADRQLFWYNNLLRYAAKHYSAAGRNIVAAAVILASVPRSIAAVISGRSPGSVSIYLEVIRAAYAAFGGLSDVQRDASSPSPREGNRAKRLS